MLAAASNAASQPVPNAPKKAAIETVLVTAKRRQLLGRASTASEGVVDDTELQLTPAYRPGQLLETVPGPGGHPA